MQAGWDDAERARRWDGCHLDGNPTRGPQLDLLLELLDGAAAGWCLDLGCGSGLVAERLLERRADLSVLGVDASEPMLDLARPRLARFGDRVRLHRADLADPGRLADLDPPACAAAIAVQALHHLDRAQLGRLLAWTHGRLEPGGLLAIIDPVLIPSRDLYPSFRLAKARLGWRWNPDGFDGYLRGLAGDHDRPQRLEDYVALMVEAGLDAACLDLRADRALLLGRRPDDRPEPPAAANSG